MPEETLQTCVYHVLRYTPNLVRDEWINIGVVIHDPKTSRGRARLIEDQSEFSRVHKLHPTADLDLLRALQADFEAQFEEHRNNVPTWISRLDDTLSNALQFSPQRGVLTGDLDAELDRLYRDHVSVPHYRRTAAEAASTRGGIRARASQVFRGAGILGKMEKGVRIEEFTFPGDRLKLDYAYRSNGTRGFAHALVLSGDPAQAKVLAFTAESIRAKLAQAEFVAVTETPPAPGNETHQFVARLFDAQRIELVPLSGLEGFANRLRPTIH